MSSDKDLAMDLTVDQLDVLDAPGWGFWKKAVIVATGVAVSVTISTIIVT